jgi:hypothetical protein
MVPGSRGPDPNELRQECQRQILSWNAIEEEKSRGVEIWKNGHLQTFGGNVSGGSNLVQYYLSSDFDKTKGIEPNNHLGPIHRERQPERHAGPHDRLSTRASGT